MKIELENNCHQNWDRMSPAEGGRFCNQCNKTVIDFSGLSHQEILARLSTGTKLCGRFTNVQLDRHVAGPVELNPRKSLFTWLSGLLLFFSYKPLSAGRQPVATEQGPAHHTSSGIRFSIPEIEKDSVRTKEEPKADKPSRPKKEKGVAFRTKRNTFYWCRRFPFIRKRRCYMGGISVHESVRLTN